MNRKKVVAMAALALFLCSRTARAAGTLAAQYPGDVGIGADSSVVWSENFEESTLSAFTSRYDTVNNSTGMAFVTNVPAASSGTHALGLTSSGSGANATDFYKNFINFSSGYTELYYRWYVKYQAGIAWHHSGFWCGGYNPATNWANPQAGSKPSGSDRVEIAIEPVWGTGTLSPRLDFYNYWMNQHTCSGCGGSYWGNAAVCRLSFTNDENQWMCLELHVKLNTNLASAAGAMLEVWKNDTLVQSYPETGTVGYWVQDHFCPNGADGPECNYSPSAAGPLDIQFRNSSSLVLNNFWPQNYITTAGVTGTMYLDDMVVATERIGCTVPVGTPPAKKPAQPTSLQASVH